MKTMTMSQRSQKKMMRKKNLFLKKIIKSTIRPLRNLALINNITKSTLRKIRGAAR